MRIGHGFDVHKFGGEGPLVIGGVRIPYEKGLLAHSDGDVALHAATDALLGAAALGISASCSRILTRPSKVPIAASCCAKPGNASAPRAIVWATWTSLLLPRPLKWPRISRRCAFSWRKTCNAIWTTLTLRLPPPNNSVSPGVARVLPAKRLPC